MPDHAAHLQTQLELPTGEWVSIRLPLTVWTSVKAMDEVLRVLGADPITSEGAWLEEVARIIDCSERAIP